MSRRKQTKPLRLNEDEELQTGKTSVVRQSLAGDGSLSTVCCDWTGCLGHCTPGDINCYLTGPGGRRGGRQEWEAVEVSVLIIAVIVPLGGGWCGGGEGGGQGGAIFRCRNHEWERCIIQSLHRDINITWDVSVALSTLHSCLDRA